MKRIENCVEIGIVLWKDFDASFTNNNLQVNSDIKEQDETPEKNIISNDEEQDVEDINDNPKDNSNANNNANNNGNNGNIGAVNKEIHSSDLYIVDVDRTSQNQHMKEEKKIDSVSTKKRGISPTGTNPSPSNPNPNNNNIETITRIIIPQKEQNLAALYNLMENLFIQQTLIRLAKKQIVQENLYFINAVKVYKDPLLRNQGK